MNKLKDNTGASITFALLLFMVCAVVSSVLITAGTVAVGRISESSSTDSRYYSVMSAVNVLDDLYSDSNVTLRKTVVTHNIIPVTGTGEKTGYSDSPVIKVLLDGNAVSSGESVVTDASCRLAGTGVDFVTEPITSNFEREFEIDISDGSTDVEELGLKVHETLMPDGTLYLDVSNNKESDVYTVRMIFGCDQKSTTDTSRTVSNPQKGEGGFHRTETVTTVDNYEYFWDLTRIEVLNDET